VVLQIDAWRSFAAHDAGICRLPLHVAQPQSYTGMAFRFIVVQHSRFDLKHDTAMLTAILIIAILCVRPSIRPSICLLYMMLVLSSRLLFPKFSSYS